MSGTSSVVDSSIPLQAGRGSATPPNPLQQIEQFALTKNLLNQNALFPGTKTLQQQQIQGGQLGLEKQFRQAAYNALAPLLAGGPITHDSMTSALGALEQTGISTHGVLNDLLATAPTGDGPAFDAKARALITANSQTDPATAVRMVTPQQGT